MASNSGVEDVKNWRARHGGSLRCPAVTRLIMLEIAHGYNLLAQPVQDTIIAIVRDKIFQLAIEDCPPGPTIISAVGVLMKKGGFGRIVAGRRR
jgi:hypothetical protein